MSLLLQTERIVSLLGGVTDVLDERVTDREPAWAEKRGWTPFLLGLTGDQLALCERSGLGEVIERLPGAPADLVDLAREAREVTHIGIFEARGDTAASRITSEMRAVRARKRDELVGLSAAAAKMAVSARRIVDVGAGTGHFTTLSAELFGREVVGLERRADRVRAATERAAARRDAIETRGGAARFLEVHADRDTLSFEEGDLAVGLHACGSLGDKLVVCAAEAGCDVILVSCCLQKMEGEVRAPLSLAMGLPLRREILGLSNLTSQAEGVETTLAATMSARNARFCVLQLLKSRGLTVSPGEEMRGINRRRARGGFADLAARACEVRGLPLPSEEEIRRLEALGTELFGAVRRLSLPRNMLSRPVELLVVLDRAAVLLERGFHARVGALFDRSVSPRNVALFASRAPERLPRQ